MGDFNYLDIDWENWNTKGDNTNSHEYKFAETIEDNFIYQLTRKQKDCEALISQRVNNVDQLVSMLLISLSTVYLAIFF
jgi:hypothetical protein